MIQRTLLSVLRAAGVSLCLAWTSTAWCQAAPGWEDPAAIQAVARSYLDGLGAERAAASGGVAHIEVGAVDPRLHVAACPELAAALPPGAKHSGRTLVAVRCMGGRAWQVFLPAEIHVQAPVWVTAQAFPAGHTVQASDLTQDEQDIGLDDGPTRLLTVASGSVTGQMLARPMQTGVALRAQDLHDPNQVGPGDPVNVVYSGSGFTVSTEGKAVGAAQPGQALQVRTAGGTLVSGILGAEHEVDIRL